MDDLAVEEHSLLMLREQLGAVQHIRRELERRDAQISNLKVQLTETQSFREQAIGLRAQCRILEERMSLLETAKDEAVSKEEARADALLLRVRELEEERDALAQREVGLRQAQQEEDLNHQQREVELELTTRRLDETLRRGDEMQSTIERLQSDKVQGREEVSSLHGIIEGLRKELRAKEVEVEELRVLKPRLQEAEDMVQDLRVENGKAQAELKRMAFLEVQEIDRLRNANFDLEKQMLLDRTASESDHLRVLSLTNEVEGLRQVMARQEQCIEEKDRDLVRLRAIEDESLYAKKHWEELRRENDQVTVEMARLKREHRHVLTHVEGLLGALTRSSRDTVKEASLRILEALFSRGGDDDGGDGSMTPVMGEEQHVLWLRMRSVVEEVGTILSRYWEGSEKLHEASERVTELETQNITLLAKLQGVEDELSRTSTDLRDARSSVSNLDAVVVGMKANVAALQQATQEMQSELHERDRFLNRVHAQLSLSIPPAPGDDGAAADLYHPSSPPPRPPPSSSRPMASTTTTTFLLTDSSSAGTSPLPPPPPASSTRRPGEGGGAEEGMMDFYSLQSTVSCYVKELLSRIADLEKGAEEMRKEMRRREVELDEERVAHEVQIRELHHDYDSQLSVLRETCRRLDMTVTETRSKGETNVQEAVDRLTAEIRTCRSLLEEAKSERDDVTATLAIAQRDLTALRDRYSRARAALILVARVALITTERFRQLCTHKAILSRENGSYQRLYTEALALSLAVSGEYGSSSSSRRGSPLPSHHQHPSSSPSSSPVSFRGAVIAVLFAHRLLPRFRSRLLPDGGVDYHHHHRAITTITADCEPNLPGREEIESRTTQQAYRLIITSLARANAAAAIDDDDGDGGGGGRRQSLLERLVFGGREMEARRERMNEMSAWGGDNDVASIGGGGGGGGHHHHHHHRELSSGRAVMQIIRRAFLTMSRSLAGMKGEVMELRREVEVAMGESEERARQLKGKDEALKECEAMVKVTEERLAISERERRAMVPREERDMVQEGMQAAKDSVNMLQEELTKARDEIHALSTKLHAADANLTEQSRLVLRERMAHKEMEEEACQWRRYAMRYQQENAELQDKSLRGGGGRVSGGGGGGGWRLKSPGREPVGENNMETSFASSTSTTASATTTTGGGGGGGWGQVQQQQRIMVNKTLDEIEGLVTRLARAEEAMEGKTTHADALGATVRRLLSERLEQEDTLDRLKRGAQHTYAQHERVRAEGEARSREVFRELEEMRKQLKEAEAQRHSDSLQRSQRRDLLRKQQEAQTELERALLTLHDTSSASLLGTSIIGNSERGAT